MVGIVLVIMCVVSIMSARYAFRDPPNLADQNALAIHQDKQKFAQDILKTLVGFFAGMVTGILVGK